MYFSNTYGSNEIFSNYSQPSLFFDPRFPNKMNNGVYLRYPNLRNKYNRKNYPSRNDYFYSPSHSRYSRRDYSGSTRGYQTGYDRRNHQISPSPRRRILRCYSDDERYNRRFYRSNNRSLYENEQHFEYFDENEQRNREYRINKQNKMKKKYKCHICRVTVDDERSFIDHLRGKRHIYKHNERRTIGKRNKSRKPKDSPTKKNQEEDSLPRRESVIFVKENENFVCPITKDLIEIPMKSLKCSHVYSKFGIESLFSNEKEKQKSNDVNISIKCPIAGCNKLIKQSDVKFDDRTEKRIKELSERNDHSNGLIDVKNVILID